MGSMDFVRGLLNLFLNVCKDFADEKNDVR